MIEVGCPTCGKTNECEITEKPFEDPVTCCTWIFIGILPEEPRVHEYRPTDVVENCQSLIVHSGGKGEIFAVNKEEAIEYNENL
ncbi:hypothetical protein AMET1_0366 [Methanonatronarchaeum thermophilum]|uniref:Uncharacterized protein n=1 Tax=Methanonatronarchaeum thermophilum TaxID=1927129 RepID=A0A1Y3GH65_9EURY|nr:hypothetical protein [Methanonatronarchaeum thermophilum]OUJ18716.1 hypothetical protein AMET1_0366 [Methanonatronarchaeum thermophilum]